MAGSPASSGAGWASSAGGLMGSVEAAPEEDEGWATFSATLSSVEATMRSAFAPLDVELSRWRAGAARAADDAAAVRPVDGRQQLQGRERLGLRVRDWQQREAANRGVSAQEHLPWGCQRQDEQQDG